MKFTRRFKVFFYLFFTALFITGSVWWYLEKFVRVQGAFGEDHHPLQNILIRIHGTIAYFTLLIIGYLIHSHIKPGLKSKKKRSLKTGWIMIIATTVLILTSAMDLFGPEASIRDILIQTHRYLGLFFPLILAVHLIDRRRTAKKVHAHPAAFVTQRHGHH